ncbi:MAG: 8-amino-7-oxononanoate synthase [Kiritimatiellae bacterium]|nr:8-amino-7-oxononanoate synthase [Kiritimatiellia bacterium]MDD5519382.1 8-amino-7-oxononanoate synthase [Kiritimatiellia bacterium]
MHSEEWISSILKELESQSLDRHLIVRPEAGGKIHIDGKVILNFSSNDYLNLANHPVVVESSIDYVKKYGCGATASRLMSGTLSCHKELEKALAELKCYPAALVFGSGWLANAGTIPVLVERDDHIFADKLVHASIIDAIIMSRANFHRFNHNDAGHLAVLMNKCPAKGRRLVVTESVFSMDGDIAPLRQIADIAVKYNAMIMVDEAHSTGIFGSNGSGLVRELNLESLVNISMGTLSKALGGYGGFIACSESIKEVMINKARTFIYTTALPPAVIGSALGSLKVLKTNPELGKTLLNNARFFRERLNEAGLKTGSSESQIIPVMVGNPAKTLELSRELAGKNILAVAIRPPTVPAETARLRLSVTLAHTQEDMTRAATVIAECAREKGII